MHLRNKIYFLFEEQAKSNPNKIAISYLNEEITYDELNKKANKLARWLKEFGIKPGEFVVVLSSKSIDTLISILAILKINAAYIPLHKDIKCNMLSSICRSSKTKIILTELSLLNNITDIKLPKICFEDFQDILTKYSFLNIESNMDDYSIDIAYAIYTSGTTGIPKGVVITHENLLYTYNSWEKIYELHSTDVHIQMADPSFDVFTGEFIRSLCSGAKLVICPKNIVIDIKKLHAFILTKKINCIEFTPCVLRKYLFFLDSHSSYIPKLRLVICGSDIWTLSEYRKAKKIFGENTRVINSYGSTEATIDSTYYEEQDDIENSNLSLNSIVPIGKPFPHVNIYIINDNYKKASLNEIGEIYIGGRGVSLGYINLDRLTNESFVKLSHINTNERLYKTGDFGKILPDGNIDFIGRNQSIIKINGQRVELLSLESILNQHPKIKQSIVIPELTKYQKYLITCLILPKDECISFSEICEHIKLNLPSYYLPKKIMLISEIVINKNGKVEKNINLQKITKELKKDLSYPNTMIEHQIKDIWTKVVGHKNIGINCDFYEFGGSSLSLISVLESINRAYGIKITYSDSIRTIKILSKLVEDTLDINNTHKNSKGEQYA